MKTSTTVPKGEFIEQLSGVKLFFMVVYNRYLNFFSTWNTGDGESYLLTFLICLALKFWISSVYENTYISNTFISLYEIFFFCVSIPAFVYLIQIVEKYFKDFYKEMRDLNERN